MTAEVSVEIWIELVNECVALISASVTDVDARGKYDACMAASNGNIYGIYKLRKSLAALPQDRIFGNPDAEIVVQRLAVILGNRHKSAQTPLPLCPRCNQPGIVSGVRGTDLRLCTPCKAGREPEECFKCGETRRVYARLGRIPYCQSCWDRPAPQRRPRPCATCGATTRNLKLCPSCSPNRPPGLCEICLQEKKHVRTFPERLVCESCVQMMIRYPKPCSRCARTSVALFGRLDERLCSSCAGHGPPPFACKGCGSEDAGREGTRCFRCKKEAAIDTVLPRGYFDDDALSRIRALIDRPEMTARGVVEWCEQSKAAALLRQMARGEVPATSATFHALPQSRATAQLQGILIESGIILPGDDDLDRYVDWSRAVLEQIQPATDRMLLTQYSRWFIERKLILTTPRIRRSDTARMLRARYQLEAAIRCLGSLHDCGTSMEHATQSDIDLLLVEYRNQRRHVIAFLRWAHENLAVRYSKPTYPDDKTPIAPMPTAERQEHIMRLLEDDSIALATRVGGLFLLVFGQSLGRIVTIRTTAFSHLDQRLLTHLGRDSVRIPPPMDDLILAQIDWSNRCRVGTEPWLFPGYAAGTHLTSDALARGLKRLGIRPTPARNAAMLDLAANMPARVLSDLLGYAHGTAERWARASGRRWASYAALRAQEPR